MPDSTYYNIQPPKWPTKILQWVLKREYLEEIEGDMEEIFQDNIQQFNLQKAKRMYAWELFKLLRPALLKKLNVNSFNQISMFKNYFKVTWRNLIKKPGYSFINIFGLGLGIACCFLIFMYVQDELSYDNYHEKRDRIFRVTHAFKASKTSTEDPHTLPAWVWGNAPVGPALKNEFPEIETVVQFSGRSDILLSAGDKLYQEEGVFFMDSSVFDIFSWKLKKGNPKTALAAPYSIVLTETTAKKYFGDEDPIGQVLKGSESAGRADAGDYTVTGVMADVPSNSHFKFNALLSLNTFRKSKPDDFDAWGYVDFYTYFLVNKQFDQKLFEQKLASYLARTQDPESTYVIVIEPMRDFYLHTHADRQPGETGSMANIYVFSCIGLFILLIAMINFMNLSTARSMERAKEVGIRKSIGAFRGSLIFQFLGESFMIIFLSMIVAVILISASLPSITDLTNKTFQLQNLFTWQTALIFLAGLIVIGLVAGSYPAFALSGFLPAKVLKGVQSTRMSGANFRRGLVIFQFSLCIAIIAGTIIVYSQMNHILNKDLGFDKEQMMVLDYNYDGKVNNKSEALKVALESNPAILSAAYSRSVPGSYFPNAGTQIETPDGEMKADGQAIFQVGIDFIDHFGMKIIAGRSYSREHPSDSTQALVVNEAAARQYGYANPADIVGKKFDQWGRKGEVIGVVKDFNFISLHRTIEPLTLPFEAYASRYLSLKIKSENLTQTIEDVRKVWNEFAPHRPFLYSFLDDDFNRQYKSDFIFRKLFTVFSCLAISIACLGLLGLATYTAELKTKEIGIRKVLGAEMHNIISLLSKDFILLVGISILIATPISWYAMNKWLSNFAFRIDVQVWVFILAGLIAVSIAIFTIGYQAIKSALINPVQSLRNE